MINKEDKADVKRVMGGKVASKVAKATNDAKSKALEKAKGEGIGKGTGVPKSKWGAKQGNFMKVMPGDRY